MADSSVRPAKRMKLLDADEDDAGSAQPEDELQINAQYAKRFEHNSKRDELFRLEQKYGNSKSKTRKQHEVQADSDSESTSEDEDEGDLATEQVDGEIFATLQAIRQKDSRIYDKDHTFYQQSLNPSGLQEEARSVKPLSLQDYHRRNLLNRDHHGETATHAQPSYAEEQHALKEDLLKQMHREAANQSNNEDSDDELLRTKSRPAKRTAVTHDLPAATDADQDPEAFLSNLMTSRAWVRNDASQAHPFESDDEDEENAADQFEEAYNMRFEDPERANETLRSHSRKAAEQFSVRRNELTGRRKAREVERSLKDAEKREREADRARLRNLRVEQTHQKLQQLKEAAGMRDADLPMDEWSKFMEAAFDSDKWDAEFQNRFGDTYYAQKDNLEPNDAVDGSPSQAEDLDKPQWTHDIDIRDLVPDFEQDEAADFSLSEDEPAGLHEHQHGSKSDASQTAQESRNEKPAGNHAEQKRRRRKERRKIEEMVDANMANDAFSHGTSKQAPNAGFRYRATSPTSYGLSARDILLAEDRDLNQHHGLKKLAAFRDAERKQKDKGKLDKKRLQKWRKETFGDRHGPRSSFQDYVKRKLDPNGMEWG
ncbi:MAG: hypothetical protein Q9159_003696 [Coniocarpon cinnabarinum]